MLTLTKNGLVSASGRASDARHRQRVCRKRAALKSMKAPRKRNVLKPRCVLLWLLSAVLVYCFYVSDSIAAWDALTLFTFDSSLSRPPSMLGSFHHGSHTALFTTLHTMMRRRRLLLRLLSAVSQIGSYALWHCGRTMVGMQSYVNLLSAFKQTCLTLGAAKMRTRSITRFVWFCRTGHMSCVWTDTHLQGKHFVIAGLPVGISSERSQTLMFTRLVAGTHTTHMKLGFHKVLFLWFCCFSIIQGSGVCASNVSNISNISSALNFSIDRSSVARVSIVACDALTISSLPSSLPSTIVSSHYGSHTAPSTTDQRHGHCRCIGHASFLSASRGGVELFTGIMSRNVVWR
jgi:hypothetical protein